MSELAGKAIVIIGALFNLFGCIGLIRLPDVYNRLQGATKCVTLGTCSILLGVLISSGVSPTGLKALAAILFIVITAPTAAHALSRGAHKSGIPLWEGSMVDKYEEDKS
jgi:multicomponent Na+:H+ antiporter subunit G